MQGSRGDTAGDAQGVGTPELAVLFHIVPTLEDTGRWTNTQTGSILNGVANLNGDRPHHARFYYTPDDATAPYERADDRGGRVSFVRLLDDPNDEVLSEEFKYRFLDAKRTVYHQMVHPVVHWRRAYATPDDARRGIDSELRFALAASKQIVADRTREQILVVQDLPMITTAWLSTQKLLDPEIRPAFDELFDAHGLGREFAEHCERLAALTTPTPAMSWFHHTCIPTRESFTTLVALDAPYARVIETVLAHTNVVLQTQRDLDMLTDLVGEPGPWITRRVQPFGFDLDSRLRISARAEQLSYWNEVRDAGVTPDDVVIGVMTREDDPKNNLDTVFTAVKSMLDARSDPAFDRRVVLLLQTQRTRAGGDYQEQVVRNEGSAMLLKLAHPDVRVRWFRDGIGNRGNVIASLSDVFIASAAPGGLEVTPVETLHFVEQRFRGELAPECQAIYDAMRGDRDRPVALVVNEGAGIAEHLASVAMPGLQVFSTNNFMPRLSEAVTQPVGSWSQGQRAAFAALQDRLDGPRWFQSLIETALGYDPGRVARRDTDLGRDRL